MIWDHPEKYHYRWRRRFAWLPRRVGQHRIWLSSYAWRFLTSSEKDDLVPGWQTEWSFYVRRLWQLPNGYTCFSERMSLSSIEHWRELRDGKPPLNVVPLPTSGDME